MKTTRLTTLLSAVFAISLAFAGSARVDTVNGRSGAVEGNGVATANPGDVINEGKIIETPADGSLKLTLSNGTKLTLGPKTRLVLKFSGDVVTIQLLRGSLSGDFTAGTSVSTPVGVASVGGTKAGLQLSDGKLSVAPASGTVSVTPVDPKRNPITVPAGNAVTITRTGETKPSALNPDQFAAINSGSVAQNLAAEPPVAQGKPAPAPAPAPAGSTPNLTQIGEISP